MVHGKRLMVCGSVMVMAFALSPALAAPAKKAATPAAKPAAPAIKQVVTGPVERYWVSTATGSGLSLSGGMPSMGSMMSMMTGGGGNVSHTLNLRMGSSQAATAEPAGSHIPPAGMKVKELPLWWKVTPTGPAEPVEESEDKTPEPPKGKILIFWGCGEHAPANQPVVIDLSKITDPTARLTEFKKLATGVTLDGAVGPLPSNWKTYSEWPNTKFKPKDVKADSSLIGAHAIKTNYGPQIDFTLDATQDFMPAIDASTAATASGAATLNWSPITGAKGIVATAIGGGEKDTVVIWSSAAMQTGWFVSPEYLTPNDITRLLGSKALLPGSATTCTVPAEAMKAMNAGIYGITAYGQEVNLSYPPRPTDPKVAWNIQWETKVRYRTSTGGMLGQDMAGMGSASDEAQPSGDKPKKKKRSIMGEIVKQGVGSFIP